MTEMTLAEELLLVALDDEEGHDTANWGSGIEAGLAGAILLELALAGHLAPEDGKLVAANGDPPRDPLGAEALDLVRAEEKPRDAGTWIGRIKKELDPLRGRVAERLVERGVLAEEHGKFLGMFRSTSYPERDPEPERRLRAQLADVLVTGREPTAHESMLVSLLHANDLVKRVVPKEERKEARGRAKDIANGEHVGAAVRRVMLELDVATMTAMIASSIAVTSTGAGD
jgi:golgi phosphoprotein 3